MKNVIAKLLFFTVLVVFCVQATEFRSPYVDGGPIRYRFEKLDNNCWNLDIWSLSHRREAHKAFMSHGFDTKSLSTLLFNKENISLNEIFPNSEVPTDSEYYSPYMNIMTIYPRITYYEWGTNVGLRFDYPVFGKKDRLGFRVNVPFRSIEIERENITNKEADPKKDYVLSRHVSLETGDDSIADNDVSRTVSIYSFNLLHRLKQDDGTLAVEYGNGTVKIFGQEITVANANFAINKKMATNLGSPAAAVIYKSGTGTPGKPAEPTGARQAEHWAFNTTDDTDRDYTNAYVQADGQSKGGTASEIIKNAVFFNKGENYGANVDSDSKVPYLDSNGWLILGYDNGALSNNAQNIKEGFDDAISLYTENPYQWMLSKGDFEFETDSRTGLGDIDIETFYEHYFDDRWWGEISVGVRLPTGSSGDYYGNPYKAQLGNGEHFELLFGGQLGWMALDWLDVKCSVKYSQVLEETEHRTAAFEGAKIKNIGPKVDADVSWSYIIGRLDFSIYQPFHNEDIVTAIGFEFYYKATDNIKYRQRTALPWYGNQIDGTSNAANLDASLAQKNTEQYGYKIRIEETCRINNWFEIFAGGTYMLAGQNIPREVDYHAGFNVKF